MTFLPQFHNDDKILSEQIKLIHQSCELGDKSILLWFFLLNLFVIGKIVRSHFRKKQIEQSPRTEAHKELHILLISNIVFCYLPLMFINSESSTDFILSLTISTGGLSCGAVAAFGMCRPILFAYVVPKMLSIILMLFLLQNDVYSNLLYATVLFLISILWFSAKIERTITESIELRLSNERLVSKLRTANKAKSMFLASASHDLRQPLHALGLLNESLGSMQLNQQQFEVQQHMMSAVDSTRTMLDGLLDISKLEAGAITPSAKPFFIQSVFNKLEDELAATASEANIVYRSRETISAAYADRFIVELMLRNLISNAIQYTKKGGILVACRNRKPDQLVIEVWDTGIGIPNTKTKKIFNEFQQLDNPERDSKKGFGLGLAITKGLAKTMNSNLTVSSKLGTGSVFRFTLPVSSTEVVEDISEIDHNISFIGKSVLVIDDNQSIRVSMQKLLSSWGCQCLCAESIEQALKKIKNQSIDIMLVDYRLRNERTGSEAIELISRHLKKNIPAIIITGDTAADRIKEAQAVDAILMHKPVSTKQLMRMMNHLLSS